MRRPGRPRPRPAGEADHDPGSGQIPSGVLGLDIGGTSSRARLRDAAGGLRDAEGPGANVAPLDPGTVAGRVTQLVSALAPLEPAACCAGAAGAEVAEGRARLEALLARLLPGCRLLVVHDARLVLAAAGLDAGIALIAGTGSVAYGRAPDGREAQRGGWGWMIGDDGSGVWITREAARLVIGRADAGLPPSELDAALLASCGAAGVRELILNLHARREPMEWAALAAVVFETAAGDAGSREIIRRAGAELAGRALEVRGALGIDGPVVLAGGLLLHHERLEEAVRAGLPHVECIRLEPPPVAGAVRLADELLRG